MTEITRDKAIEAARELVKEHKIGVGELGIKPSPLKGRKIPAKFFGPNGEEWSGRGRKPRWWVE